MLFFAVPFFALFLDEVDFLVEEAGADFFFVAFFAADFLAVFLVVFLAAMVTPLH